MLTKQDLKNIGDLIDIKLEEKLESKLTPILKDIIIIKKDVKKIKKVIETDFGYHEKHHIYVVKNVQQIQRDLDMPVMTIDPPDINNF